MPVGEFVSNGDVEQIPVQTGPRQQCILDFMTHRQIRENVFERLVEDRVHHGEQAHEEEIVLKLSELKTEINLLGFRLSKGRRLVIEGDAGDFTGIGLEGGELFVEGNAKNWTGAGMRNGKILVKKNIGLHTGEWMMGGEIYVGGRVRGLGNIVDGKVYERDKLVYPGKVRYPNQYY